MLCGIGIPNIPPFRVNSQCCAPSRNAVPTVPFCISRARPSAKTMDWPFSPTACEALWAAPLITSLSLVNHSITRDFDGLWWCCWIMLNNIEISKKNSAFQDGSIFTSPCDTHTFHMHFTLHSDGRSPRRQWSGDRRRPSNWWRRHCNSTGSWPTGAILARPCCNMLKPPKKFGKNSEKSEDSANSRNNSRKAGTRRWAYSMLMQSLPSQKVRWNAAETALMLKNNRKIICNIAAMACVFILQDLSKVPSFQEHLPRAHATLLHLSQLWKDFVCTKQNNIGTT